MRVLVTGGAGYIGSHTLVELAAMGYETCVVDSYANSSPIALDRVRAITNGHIEAHDVDIRDTAALTAVAVAFRPDAVIHFAGLKAVGESRTRPVDYYDVNVTGTLSLIRAMEAAGCNKIVFSSSATVYGEPQFLPMTEDHPLAPTNVYGETKFTAEKLLSAWAEAAPGRTSILLRYFNPVGAHASGTIGEDPVGIPNNLMPFLAQVATGRREKLAVFGDDYDTPDGTGVRDYIHVVDLANAHVAALNFNGEGAEAFNIGTGTGYSVKEMLAAFSASVGRDLPFAVQPRRPGDVAEMRADATKAANVLGWRAEYGLRDMTDSVWKWQSANPMGYGE
ncbi:UDP-glucose 4-epimerase GalE [Ketogulonicigenium vulgare]|uniref:UDP-glucose 4-epimerase GalE n=1 Tax=Ketogulonicigenium vulgare TaxID=92945 RepID=UPI0001E677D0|nr:UDP-glucose 4-epimerase GalE [Ketogulonicigenium vulgare]ADO42034.1 UDP-glucose 4-epimerase [Ketogulonicigenium vulgare Y25]ALJ80454.1 UDP-glucose 4-epimerase [Ketogulonicigenium vulgare]ANW33281.1 UDP-glucose 4-epimerase GalE [Ketogulonicigenium vulgare]AOZ53960.1 UDP-glucose 4-epimerase [Ketogulonicigenium vulgare]